MIQIRDWDLSRAYPTRWQRFLLFFVKSEFSFDDGGGKDVPTRIKFKRMGGVIYILERLQLPPEHPNSRCTMETIL